MVFIFVASITKLEGTGMVVVTEVVTGLDVVAADMVVVAAGEDVEAANMVLVAPVAEVVTGLVLDVTRTVVAGVEDAIFPATSPLNSIRSLCPLKMIFLLVPFIFLLR